MDVFVIVVVVVVTALIFDFTNGFHDTANAMATSIATGALRPKVAVAIAGCLNLVGAFLSVEVAKTISGGLVDETLINPVVIFAGLVGAILWNLVTWFLGLPSSSSHALFGGLIGATWVAGGVDAIHFNAVLNKVVLPAVLSPVVAALIAVTVTYLALRVTARAEPGVVSRGFKVGQTVSSSMVALAHGTNDAQKTMGVITLTLITAGMLAPGSAPPFWVVADRRLGDRARYLHGWLADHPDARQARQRHPSRPGLQRRDDQRRGDPDLHPPRAAAVDHAGVHGLDLRCGGGSPAGVGALGHGRADRAGLELHPALGGGRGRGGVVAGRDRHRRRDRRRGERAGCGRGDLRRVAPQRGHRGKRQRRATSTGRDIAA